MNQGMKDIRLLEGQRLAPPNTHAEINKELDILVGRHLDDYIFSSRLAVYFTDKKVRGDRYYQMKISNGGECQEFN